MNSKKIIYLFHSFLLFFSLILSSKFAAANKIEIIVPLSPPHVMVDDQNEIKGRMSDIIVEAFKRCDKKVHLIAVPFGRHWDDFIGGKGVGVLSSFTPPKDLGGYRTKIFFSMLDGITVVDGLGLDKAKSLDDLKGKRVVGFTGAQKILNFERLVPVFAHYEEKSRQDLQVNLLFDKKSDAAIGDGLIIAYDIFKKRKKFQSGEKIGFDPTQKFFFRPIFEPNPIGIVFREKSLAEDLNRCYDQMEKDGTLDKMASKYLDQLRDVVGDLYPKVK
jgi:hypothetical protein